MTDELRKDDEPVKIPEVLPVLPLRDIVIFPFMIVPLYVSRDRSIKAVDQALADNRMILLAAQKRRTTRTRAPTTSTRRARWPSSCAC
jgi:ATP-dependent Lon protease